MAYKIHIGSLIEERFKKRGCSKTWFAQQIHCDRTNIYGIFKNETIDVKRLYDISLVLDYDFFALIQEELKKDGLNSVV
ncbi:MAG: XRE family transcriptional regulator [Bacteroidales bacterium]|nr:XRE family transcriptional regulator [Bacteroidales bacterium]